MQYQPVVPLVQPTLYQSNRCLELALPCSSEVLDGFYRYTGSCRSFKSTAAFYVKVEDLLCALMAMQTSTGRIRYAAVDMLLDISDIGKGQTAACLEIPSDSDWESEMSVVFIDESGNRFYGFEWSQYLPDVIAGHESLYFWLRSL